jgi:GNAT superfamily N-acetyltransferase
MMSDAAMPSIERVGAEEARTALPELTDLLRDTVEGGASIGFLPPMSEEEARRYWSEVSQDVARETCVLLVARDGGRIVGTVQLALETKPNAAHRAEVRKLLVMRSERRRGTGRALMGAVERAAHDYGRTLLVLDTRQGDDAERLYSALGYQEAGVIPAFARNAAGTLDSTVVFYKLLRPDG